MMHIQCILAFVLLSTTSSMQVSRNGCGVTKGCWFEPKDCSPQTNCSYMLTWEARQNGVRLELGTSTGDLKSPNNGKYISVGFSFDEKMGDDSVVECISLSNGTVSAFISFNDRTHNSQLIEASRSMLSNIDGSHANGILACSVERLYSPSPNDRSIKSEDMFKLFDLKSKAYILFLAKGNTNGPGSFMKSAHYMMDGDLFPFISTDSIRIDAVPPTQLVSGKHYNIPRSIQYQLAKAHGILMLIAWWVFGTTSMLMARYFKNMWPKRMPFGLKLWFHFHRNGMLITVVVQCVAFMLIFIQAGDLKDCGYACDDRDYSLYLHTILGITVTAAALIQPFLALLRPGPSHSKRPLFNWLHWFLGTGSWLLATVAIFLALPLGKTALSRTWGRIPQFLMAGYVSSYILTTILLEIIVWQSEIRKYRPPGVSGMALTSLSGPNSAQTSDSGKSLADGPDHGWLKVFVMSIFVLIALGIVIALCCLIGLVQR